MHSLRELVKKNGFLTPPFSGLKNKYPSTFKMVSYHKFVNTFSVHTTQLKTKAIKHNETPILSNTAISYLVSLIPHMAGSRTATKNKTTPLNY